MVKYYAVAYMDDGQIHLKPFDTKEQAQDNLNKLCASKWGPKVTFTRIVKKDFDSAWLRSVNGYWI